MTTAQPTPSAPPARRRGDAAIELLIWLAGVSVIVIVALIFFFLLREGINTFLDIPLRQLFGTRWYPIEDQYGLMPLLVGTLLVTIGAVIIAVPLGIVAAIYLGEIAPLWLRSSTRSAPRSTRWRPTAATRAPTSSPATHSRWTSTRTAARA